MAQTELQERELRKIHPDLDGTEGDVVRMALVEEELNCKNRANLQNISEFT